MQSRAQLIVSGGWQDCISTCQPNQAPNEVDNGAHGLDRRQRRALMRIGHRRGDGGAEDERPAAGRSDTCLRSYFLFHAIVLIPGFGLPFGYATFVHTETPNHWCLRLCHLGRRRWAPMNWPPSFHIWLVPHMRSAVDLPDSLNGRFRQTGPFRQGGTFFYTWCCILA